MTRSGVEDQPEARAGWRSDPTHGKVVTHMRHVKRANRLAGALSDAESRLARTGANLTVSIPGIAPVEIGARPDASRVVFRTTASVRHVVRGDALGMAEAYLAGEIDLEGDMLEIMKFTEIADLEMSPVARAFALLSAALRSRRRRNRESIAFHYDRPSGFFLPWFDRWRSYSHGFYAAADDDLTAAQERKLAYAIDALALAPGMRVLDVGSGWGSFIEYAGCRGIEVHGITISEEQYRFCRELIRERRLPCTITLTDFYDYRPEKSFDAAVFMGTFEHIFDFRRVADFLVDHLASGARIYADFCTQRERLGGGAFLKKHIWPGSARYVDVPALVGRLMRAGFNVHTLEDDTLSYACTVRDWAHRLEAARDELAREYGEPSVRAFLLFLWSSCHFLMQNRTQAYHLVAERGPAPLRPDVRA